VISKIITAWKAKAKSVVIDLTGDDLNKYVTFLKGVGIPLIEGVMSDRRVQTVACFSKGVIGLTTHEPRPQESIQLLERFAGVFDLTYTRFLDLTVAETKAHEARIEVALERVRARALAMQQPEELKDVAQVLRNEMGLLGVEELETSSIYIHPYNSEKVECWYALKDLSNSSASGLGIDWCVSPQLARELTKNKITLQGNFDPAKLLAPIPQIKEWVKEMIDGFGTQNYIANLGHGITPNVPVDHAKAFVEAVKEYSLVTS